MKRNTMLCSVALILLTSSVIVHAEPSHESKTGQNYGVEQSRKDMEVGYRIATIIGDEICKPPKDYNAAGYARPIDVLATPMEPTGNEATNMHQWYCSYSRPDGTIVQFGSSFTPLEQWRSMHHEMD